MKGKAKQNREKEEILIIGKKRLSEIVIVRLGIVSQVNYVCTSQLTMVLNCVHNASFLVPCI